MPVPAEGAIAAGPTAVQVLLDSGLVGSIVKIRKPALTWSATGSPRPLVGKGFWKLSDHPRSLPALPLVVVSVRTSSHAPCADSPTTVLPPLNTDELSSGASGA